MTTTMYDLAMRFYGLQEIEGEKHNPLVLAMLKLRTSGDRLLDFNGWPTEDEVPWCGAAMHFFAHCLGLDRPQHPLSPLRARHWLTVGKWIDLHDARMANDFVVLKRGDGPQPGPEELDAPGHVGLFAGWGSRDGLILVAGGNTRDRLDIAGFSVSDVLGVRKWATASARCRST